MRAEIKRGTETTVVVEMDIKEAERVLGGLKSLLEESLPVDHLPGQQRHVLSCLLDVVEKRWMPFIMEGS